MSKKVLDLGCGNGDNDWQKKIEWCIENKEKLQNMGENCLQKAKEYNIDEYLNKLVEFGKMS